MQSGHGTAFNHDLAIGSDVFTSDGDRIGEVKEIRGGFFKIDAAMQPDYWLAMSTIASATGGRVMLNFHKDHLGDYKESEPRAA